MDELTRRAFVKNSAGAAVSASVLGAVVAAPASADQKRRQAARARAIKKSANQRGVVAYLSDHESGEIALMHGDHTIVVRDRALAARLARLATRNAR